MLAALLLLALQDLVPDKVLEVYLRASDPLLAGHGPARTFEYPVTENAMLYVWAASEDFDPLLRVMKPTGEVWAEDDDSGGGTTAFLVFEVRVGERPRITVAAAEAQMNGTLRLHVSGRPASTGADLKSCITLVDESNAARAAGHWGTARAKVLEAVTSLLARPAAEQDAAWLALLDSAGRSARDAQDPHTANRAWKRVHEVRTATLPDEHLELQWARGNLAATMYSLGDLTGARALQEKMLEVFSRTRPDEHPDLQKAQAGLALTIKALGDLQGARALEEKVLEVRSRTLPDEHPDLQRAQKNLAWTIEALGDLQGARILQEKVLEVCSRTLPDEHPTLQSARADLAWTIKSLGDLQGARALQEKVLEVYSRTLPDDHPDLQNARAGLAPTIEALGDLQGARALKEKVLEVFSRTLPDEHPNLQMARGNLALTIKALGDLQSAHALEETVLEVRLRTLPADHPDLQRARANLAQTMRDLGDLQGARALGEKVLEVRSRTLPDDHPDLQRARMILASTIGLLGDLQGARALEEKALEVFSRTLPDEHPDLQRARTGLAGTIESLGDLQGARALKEKVLEVFSRTLPDEHPELQTARGNLAMTIEALGDLQGARALEEKVLEVRSRTLPDDHPALQRARTNLAATIEALGDLEGARALQEKVLEVRSRTLPVDHPDLQRARGNLASTILLLGDLQEARALLEKVLEVRSRTLPDDHPDLQLARGSLTGTIASQLLRARKSSGQSSEGEGERRREGGRERCAELIGALCRAQAHAARAAILGSPGREAEERCASLAKTLSVSLSFAMGYGVFEPMHELESGSFVFSETTRGAALAAAALTRRAAGAPEYAELRAALREASDALVRVARKGTTSEEFDRARKKRESVETELVALARAFPGGQQSGVTIDVDALAQRLPVGEAAVGFRRFMKARVEILDELDSTGLPKVRETLVESLCAFVVRSSQSDPNAGTRPDSPRPPFLTLVDLGPMGPIEEAVHGWRHGMGVAGDRRGVSIARAEATADVRVHGTRLRESIFDPLLPALAGTERVVVALDDVLNLVPIDALPMKDAEERVGDRWRIETRATLSELLGMPAGPIGSGKLVAVGDVDYEAPAHAGAAEADHRLAAAEVAPRAEADAGILRGGSWSGGFSALPGTAVEATGIARCFADRFGDEAASELCVRTGATRERLLSLAPRARFLHIATHGWFAAESIRSWSDPEPLDEKSGLGMRQSGEEQVKGMSPMLLCGLALAGANLPEDATGRVPGLVTADELSTLDLSNCELVVLSACDTNVGERRAGQGVASLQKALQMAGARSVITSLWKVPDAATKDLMLDFYRRLWVEEKPKHQALWEAKKRLRDAKDERGKPKYTLRDWAAWVLTGDPN